jgi:hypothetical protein
MKRVLHIAMLTLLFIAANSHYGNLYAQVKIGNNPTTLDPNAIVEIESANKGLLLPRLVLLSPTNPAPLTAFVNGMFVYNTATADSISPGLYYSDGIKWIRVSAAAASGTPGINWSVLGNSGTTTGNFLGTTDLVPLSIKTNNIERMRLTENGWVGIGTSTPNAALQIKGHLTIDSLATGNLATDSFLVANPADGKVKAVSASGFVVGVRKKLDIVLTAGQSIFTTPATITDVNKLSLYRNGVLISFTVNDANSIISEIPCAAGDEIRIIQLL